MYAYRIMTEDERRNVMNYRRLMKFPLHAPPHFGDEIGVYLLTAANYEPAHIMTSEQRRMEFEDKIMSLLATLPETEVRAWCILPNHYHLVVRMLLPAFKAAITRLHNGTSTQWNREDNTPGRKVWHHFSDRAIRSDRHYWVAVNYVNTNAVRHGYVKKSAEWPTSSFRCHLDELGLDRMKELWAEYPIGEMGKGWDEI